jgi:tripartite-type tricarboxylate transporter receptor subunit TctC
MARRRSRSRRRRPRAGSATTCIAALSLASAGAFAAWPNDKTIEVVVGFAPGGGTDLMARKLLPFVQKRLGGNVQFIVVNKPGASGDIANGYVAKAKPDGYTLAVVNVPGFLYLPMSRKTQYQASGFQLIARVVDDPTVLIARSDGTLKSLQTVVAVSKQRPGAVSVGHNGDGTNGDLAIQMLESAVRIQLNPVAYKGTGPQKIDVLGGSLQLGTVSAGEIPELHKGGTAKVIAVAQFTAKRSAALPNVPTAAEAGYKVLMSSERGFGAPHGTDAAIVARLDKAIAESLKDPAFIANASADAPVLSYLSGPQWQKSLEQNAQLLKQIAASRPKQ